MILWWILITLVVILVELAAILRRSRFDRGGINTIRCNLLFLMAFPVVLAGFLNLLQQPIVLQITLMPGLILKRVVNKI